LEKIVGFVGYECEDIVLYLAKILCKLGKKVAIIDRTEQEMLLEMLEIQDCKRNQEKDGDFSGIRITDQSICYEEYDSVFYLFGYRLIHPKLYECEALVMVTDGVPAHASLLNKIGNWERKQYLLIRNLVPMKHTERYLAVLADKEECFCEIPFDEKDIRMKYSLSSYVDGMVKYLSAGMKRALMIVLGFLAVEYSERIIKETMKRV